MRGRDLNPRPSGYEPDDLPTDLPRIVLQTDNQRNRSFMILLYLLSYPSMSRGQESNLWHKSSMRSIRYLQYCLHNYLTTKCCESKYQIGNFIEIYFSSYYNVHVSEGRGVHWKQSAISQSSGGKENWRSANWRSLSARQARPFVGMKKANGKCLLTWQNGSLKCWKSDGGGFMTDDNSSGNGRVFCWGKLSPHTTPLAGE